MSWQLLLVFYFIAGTIFSLIRRRLGQTFTKYNRLVNAFFFLGVLYPTGLIIAALSSPNLKIGWHNFLLLSIGEIGFPLMNLIAYRASKDVDAGVFQVINNIGPIIAVFIAWDLLGDKLTKNQLIGAVFVLASAFLVSLPAIFKHSKVTVTGLALAFLNTLMIGALIPYERFMLGRMDFGAYLVFGWGLQAFWMAALAWPERKKLRFIFKPNRKLAVIGYGFSATLKGLFFVGALSLSKNASLVAAYSSFLAVMVVLCTYFILREKRWVWLKMSSATIGALGLIFLYYK